MNSKKIEIGFSCFLLMIFLVFTIIAIGYNPQARVAPLVVGIPAIFLSALLLVSYYIPAVDKKINTMKQMELFEMEEKKKKGDNKQNKEEKKEPIIRELNITLWIIGLLLSIYILGFIIAIPIFVFLYLMFREKEKLSTSIIVSLGTWAGIYVMFIILLKAQLYGGVFFE
ncbi:MAG: hypothetical protein PWQ60_524 [Thermoanaerobacteraceae bacterium]|nr:hypothetical protein [Thermoanaerobacteraceae bacterium]